MELKNIADIGEGITVFMPSGIQANLSLVEDKVVVEYPEMYKDTYTKEEFEKIMQEGIFIFNEPSQKIMEGYDQKDCPAGSIYTELTNKEDKYLPSQVKIDRLTVLDKIAKENPDVFIRQQAQTFIDEMGLQEYNKKEIDKFIKDVLKDEEKEYKLLSEELGEFNNSDAIDEITSALEAHQTTGYDATELGNWVLVTSLDSKMAALTEPMKGYILEKIAAPIQDGHIAYTDLELVINDGSGLTKEDLISMDAFDEAEITEMLANSSKELTCYISYEIKFDGTLGESFKVKDKKKKKKLDEKGSKMESKVNEGTLNEDSYKVYSDIEGQTVTEFQSWTEVEEYLNKTWGEYKADMAKENAEFGTEQDKDEFMSRFDIDMPISIEIEMVENPDDICVDCDGSCSACCLDPETCEDELGTDCTEIEVPAEAEEVDMDAVIDEMCMTKLSNPEIAKEQNQQAQEDEEEKEEEKMEETFGDNMGMLTDINDLDFPGALQKAVDTKDDGSLYRISDLANELKELRAEMQKELEAIKNDIKTTLQDVKQDIKAEVNDVENKVQDTKIAVDDLTTEEDAELEDMEMLGNEEEPMDEEPVDEEPVENEEEPEEDNMEESLQTSSFKKYITGGLMDTLRFTRTKAMEEDLNKLKQEIDKMSQEGKDAKEMKDKITLMADSEEEDKQASEYAASKLGESLIPDSKVYSIKESLLATSHSSKLNGLNGLIQK